MSNVIYSINTRGHSFFPLLENDYYLDNNEIKSEIKNCFNYLNVVLKNFEVEYKDFRACLLPADNDKHFEFLFVFRLHTDDSSVYFNVQKNIISFLSKESKLNILAGDLILFDLTFEQRKRIITEMFNVLSIDIDSDFYSDYYLIYINNITKKCVLKINDFFSEKDYYLGCSDMTLNSKFKSYISNSSVISEYVKVGKNVFMADSDVDITGYTKSYNGMWSWVENGYNVIGINDILFDIFLRYKIDTSFGNVYSSEDNRYNKIRKNKKNLMFIYSK